MVKTMSNNAEKTHERFVAKVNAYLSNDENDEFDLEVVASMFEKQMAERIATGLVGVSRVENLLEVVTAKRSDRDIQSDVQFNLASDAMLAGQGISVAVENAEVTLAGDVADFTSKARAPLLAGRVRGVRSVVNLVKVRWSKSFGDGALRDRIAERLAANWATRPVAARISIQVHSGVATLTGSVDRWMQRVEAERVASYSDGVRGVVNHLSFQGAR